MKALQRCVVLVLLGVWCFPAVSSAEPARTPAADVSPAPRDATPAPVAPATAAEAEAEAGRLAAREQQAKQARDFRGGAVYIYAGSGVVLALVIVLLIILL
jgi:hypothetical protein